MTSEELDLVATLYRNGVKPLQIQAAVAGQFPGCQPKLKDIYNYTSKLRNQELIGDTPMKVLENFLRANSFAYYTRENATNDKTEDIFFCHNKSHKMWRALPEVFLIDTTYNTNMYNWALVELSVWRRHQSHFVSPTCF
ncbi:uncharacterized protein LOC143591311 [Bidens hawaiensis]|uniref:uncharacterized protein LOC143591311 n=1 Tax=Bidens hawaiensis TaxID=980011 RepID=UPI00404B2952